jgi:molybdate transport system ATP-binding protein
MLTLRNIRLPLNRITIHVDVEKLDGGITGLFGPSGSGKTTILEIVTGIRNPLSAYIELDGKLLTDTERKVHVPIEERSIGYVPQDLALFPHLSARENVLFGAHSSDGDQRFHHIVDLLEIGGLLSRGISNLSGGEKQRVAFARAVLASPTLLLLDEPLASLDRTLKKKMIGYLLHLRDEFHVPMLYVSHESDELIQLCDEVLVLEEGHLLARGRPAEVLSTA